MYTEGIYGIKKLKKSARINEDISGKMDEALFRETLSRGHLLIDDEIVLAGRLLHNEDSSVWITAEGTINNASELREYLLRQGHRFNSELDFEIIVHLYEEKGQDLMKEIKGEFAFALWDKKNKLLFIVRDRMGVKPLYYSCLEGRLIFASQIKPILINNNFELKIDMDSLQEYLSFEYVPGPQTIFKGINKLLPGHILICKDNAIQIKEYWSFSFRVDKMKQPDLICQAILEQLNQSIRSRLAGNASKGILLSGGIDSSSIIALTSQIRTEKLKTFSTGFSDKSFDESDYSDLISRRFSTEHHKILIRPQDFLDSFPNIIISLDEPLADAALIPSYLLTRFAKEKVEVCLSGDGGDELFGGYDTHTAFRLQRYYRKIPSLIRKIFAYGVRKLPPSSNRGLSYRAKKFIEGMNYPPELAYYSWWGAYGSVEKNKLLKTTPKQPLSERGLSPTIDYYLKECRWTDFLEAIFYLDLKFNLIDGSLRKIESMARLNSLELRYPFLDPCLVELSAAIPSFLKSRGLTTKYILRRAIKPFLPHKIYSAGKRGMGVPLEDWICKELKTLVCDTLSKSQISRQGFFDYRYVENLLREHMHREENHFQKIWVLVIFTFWYESIRESKNASNN